ncbi:NAD(P)-binding domain-containing protein [Paenarthrobacter sp. NPDC089322]|uniref:flavin-containing monooxygenase n=1 Tax=Paenarthrobacter sp. NPDC089322 TaxID=3155065 RepID=UPI003424D22A
MGRNNEASADTIIVGGGQSGLALGYWLSKQNHDFLILDENVRPGESWRQRWDSLRLFTPAKFDGLPGAPFPGDRLAFPTKDELADYLEGYARRFQLPLVHGVRVDEVTRRDHRFLVRSGTRTWDAGNVVVATGGYRMPKRPAFATELDSGTFQLHSRDYRNPGQLQAGPVLVVGLGNSGAEIALEVSRTHTTLLAGKASGEIPVRHGRLAARFVLPVIRFAGLHVLTLNTPVGRKAAQSFKTMATPLIRTRTKELGAAGVELVPRVAGVSDGQPMLDDGRTLTVANVIWCTGYRDDYSWLKLPYANSGGELEQQRGVSASVPGLYFIGQEFLFAAASATLPGVGRDARYVARHLTAQRPTAEPVVAHAIHL